MSATISMAMLNGASTVGPSLKFEATVDDGEGDARDVGLAFYAAVHAMGIPRALEALAHAVTVVSSDCGIEAEDNFVGAAQDLIDFWEKHDKEMYDAIQSK